MKKTKQILFNLIFKFVFLVSWPFQSNQVTLFLVLFFHKDLFFSYFPSCRYYTAPASGSPGASLSSSACLFWPASWFSHLFPRSSSGRPKSWKGPPCSERYCSSFSYWPLYLDQSWSWQEQASPHLEPAWWWNPSSPWPGSLPFLSSWFCEIFLKPQSAGG